MHARVLRRRSCQNLSLIHIYLTERYEMFVCGCEMGNAFTELNDPMDQYERYLLYTSRCV